MSCIRLPAVHCQQVQLSHTFIQHSKVWGVEPVMTHHTFRHESIGEYEKRQNQAGEVSAPTRASCSAAGSLGHMMTSAALRQYVATLKTQAAHLLCQLWVKQLLHRCMVLPARCRFHLLQDLLGCLGRWGDPRGGHWVRTGSTQCTIAADCQSSAACAS